MKKGDILFHPHFKFSDGEAGKKFLIILNTPDLQESEPYLFCKTTSQSQKKPQTPGCHAERNLYCIDANFDFFLQKTWVQFFEIFEANYAEFIKQHFSLGLEVKGQLQPSTINAVINCIKKSDDVSGYHLSLLR
jgi:hypothetical protein